MKRVIILAITSMLGMATASSQTLLAEPNNSQSFDQMLDEYVEPNTPEVSNFESVKDTSFATEKGTLLEIYQMTDNPKQVVAGVLSILLGDFGVGHFYTGQTTRGILDILFCWTGIPAIIGLAEGIIWLCDTEEEWAERVAEWNKQESALQ